MEARLGPAAPAPGAPESEVLRRFRAFAASTLQRGHVAEPALDGLRCHDRRIGALLEAWIAAAGEVAGPAAAPTLRAELAPLASRFRAAFRTTTLGRRRSGAPRSSRRAVAAAIDRVSDAFFAVDADSGRIADANPAAGALLGLTRDALVGVDALSFVPPAAHGSFWGYLDEVTEGGEPRRFHASFVDRSGGTLDVDCSITRFATRSRTLALILARPS